MIIPFNITRKTTIFKFLNIIVSAYTLLDEVQKSVKGRLPNTPISRAYSLFTLSSELLYDEYSPQPSPISISFLSPSILKLHSTL